MKDCPYCLGHGTIDHTDEAGTREVPDPSCGGTGQVEDDYPDLPAPQNPDPAPPAPEAPAPEAPAPAPAEEG